MELEYKLYDRTGDFKKQINPKDIYSPTQFQEELNSGQGSFTLKLKGDLGDFQTSDIIEVRSTTVKKLYTGIIESIEIEEFLESSILTIELLGVFTALNDLMYKSGSSRTFTASGTVGAIVKDIIDSFNTDYGALVGGTQILSTNLIKYTGSSVEVSGSSIDIDIDNDSCLDAIKKVVENTAFNFFISSEGIIYLTDVSNESEKTFTFDREILSISREISKKDLYNKLYLERTGSVEKAYEDSPSQTLFGIKEIKVIEDSINTETTQDIKGAQYISDNKDEENIVSVKLKPETIGSFLPGNLFSTLNSRNNIVQKQITKTEIRKEYLTIYLGNFVSFGKTILKS